MCLFQAKEGFGGKLETKAEAAAPAVESKQATAIAGQNPAVVLTTVLADLGSRAKETVDAFVAKQKADAQSRREQGKLIGRDLGRIIGKDATKALERFR